MQIKFVHEWSYMQQSMWEAAMNISQPCYLVNSSFVIFIPFAMTHVPASHSLTHFTVESLQLPLGMP